MDDLFEKIGFAFVVICILVAALAIPVGIAYSRRDIPDLADTPYERGRRAARHRIDADGNPYRKGDNQSIEWLDGYIDETASSKWFKIQQQLEGGVGIDIMSDDVQILVGDCRECMRRLKPRSVHCAITSPPYWGLRNYNTDPQIWGGDPQCHHRWISGTKKGVNGGSTSSKRKTKGTINFQCIPETTHTTCEKCGAWRGELGSEPSPDLFVEHLVEVFDCVWRVLRNDGVLFVNLGDSYATTNPIGNRTATGKSGLNCFRSGYIPPVHRKDTVTKGQRRHLAGIQKGNLIGVPWRFAIAMQKAGWILRNDIIWRAPNKFPESVRNRFCRNHEYVFMFVKQPGYFFDQIATRERATSEYRSSDFIPKSKKDGLAPVAAVATGASSKNRSDDISDGFRNKRTVWDIPTEPNKDGHFAAFPQALVRPCILSGTSAKGCCPDCGAPWIRRVKRKRIATRPANDSKAFGRPRDEVGNQNPERHITSKKTLGWMPSCDCFAGDPIPCTVLDPFGGTGTTLQVAIKKGRRGIVCELNPEYVEFIRKKIKRARAQKGFGF